jgi:epoxide hydrolase-like predicted phosphatase
MTANEIRAVIFDWGGVMQTLPGRERTVEWERRLALAPGTLAKVLWGELQDQLMVGAITNDEYIQQVADRLGFSSAEAADRFTDEFYSVVRLNWEVVSAVRMLRGRYKVALLTNAWPDADRLLFEKQGIDVHAEFDVYVNSADVGLCKPDPAIYLLTLERLDIASQETVFLDDNERNVEAARALGMHAIHVTDLAAAMEELEEFLAC